MESCDVLSPSTPTKGRKSRRRRRHRGHEQRGHPVGDAVPGATFDSWGKLRGAEKDGKEGEEDELISYRSNPFSVGGWATMDPSLSMVALRSYFSRGEVTVLRSSDLPYEDISRGVLTPVGIFYMGIRCTVPVACAYIGLTCLAWLVHRGWGSSSSSSTPPLDPQNPVLAVMASVLGRIHDRPTPLTKTWCLLEAAFYLYLILRLRWLQFQCPLEASLDSAPLLGRQERRLLWHRVMDAEQDDPITWLRGWFFDVVDLQSITRYDALDFISWSMFDGRAQEHLGREETADLNAFVNELEWRISLQLHGAVVQDSKKEENDNICHIDSTDEGKHCDEETLSSLEDSTFVSNNTPANRHSNDHYIIQTILPRPKKEFRFPLPDGDGEGMSSSLFFFTELYEYYRKTYEQYKARFIDNATEQVQDFRNFLLETRQSARQNATATYYQFVDPYVDKQLSALSHATGQQFQDAWNAMIAACSQVGPDEGSHGDGGGNGDDSSGGNVHPQTLRGVSQMANFVSQKKKLLRQQLRGYRRLLDGTASGGVNDSNGNRTTIAATPAQMAELMRKITRCYDAMEGIESKAREAFTRATNATSLHLRNMNTTNTQLQPPARRAPCRFAKYSYDPLLGVSQYPLAFHLAILAVTEGGLRVLMARRGFSRHTVKQISYYYHPGNSSGIPISGRMTEYDHTDEMSSSSFSGESDDDYDNDNDIPIVFVHGIGIGLIYYIGLVDQLLTLGRPVLLPEIPYVTSLRTWLSPGSVLSPGVVATTLTETLATHGHLRATFIGHSYGTSWLSYMCKYAPSTVQGLVFLDPICFCLHSSDLTKRFVYHIPDPGSVSNFVRTDATINWTIQRSFPWSRICLFTEDLDRACVGGGGMSSRGGGGGGSSVAVFLSTEDSLVPVPRVKKYLGDRGAVVESFGTNNTKSDVVGVESKQPDMERGRRNPNHTPMTVTLFHDLDHGDWVYNCNMVREVVAAVGRTSRRTTTKTMAAATHVR